MLLILLYSTFFKGRVKIAILVCFTAFCELSKKRVIFLVGSNYINTEDNYGCLIEFLSKISKLSNFNLLDLNDFTMHH